MIISNQRLFSSLNLGSSIISDDSLSDYVEGFDRNFQALTNC